MLACFSEKNHGRRVVQRQVLYLGGLNDNQRAGWVRTIEALWGENPKAKQLALFPDDRKELPILACETIRVRLDSIELRHPHGSGAHAGWGYMHGVFWNWTPFGRQRLPSSRKGTSWLNMLKTLVCYRLIDPGSEFRFHREWYLVFERKHSEARQNKAKQEEIVNEEY